MAKRRNGTDRQSVVRALLNLSRELGRDDRGMAILGEGNTSARLDDRSMLIKASGSTLAHLTAKDLVECRRSALISLLDKGDVTDQEIEEVLLGSRANTRSRKPSVESLFHAFFLTLPEVRFVGHTHAIAVNQILCSPRAHEFAGKRIFPDEIVCCGSASVFVPYSDPGFPLAKEVRTRTIAFINERNETPRVVLIKNHGIITLGRTPEAVLAAMLMAEKAATVWLGAAALGGPDFLSQQDVERIAHRSDEHQRQKALNL